MKAATIYLNFDGNCRQAMKFYERCLGGELHMMPFSEMQGGNYPKEAKDRIMHAHLAAGPTTLMASDTMPGGQFKQGNNFSICLNLDTVQELEKLFAAFGENGKVTMPLQDTFWGARFGTLVDQFGINWMFNFEKPKQ
jgi:PhnB protein